MPQLGMRTVDGVCATRKKNSASGDDVRNMPGQIKVDGYGRTLRMIHFAYREGPGVVLCCQPTLKNLTGWQRSNHPGAVNCPDCRKHEKFLLANKSG